MTNEAMTHPQESRLTALEQKCEILMTHINILGNQTAGINYRSEQWKQLSEPRSTTEAMETEAERPGFGWRLSDEARKDIEAIEDATQQPLPTLPLGSDAPPQPKAMEEEAERLARSPSVPQGESSLFEMMNRGVTPAVPPQPKEWPDGPEEADVAKFKEILERAKERKWAGSHPLVSVLMQNDIAFLLEYCITNMKRATQAEHALQCAGIVTADKVGAIPITASGELAK